MKSRSLCMNCVWLFHPVMLTGYCIRNCRCDGCGSNTDLAITTDGPVCTVSTMSQAELDARSIVTVVDHVTDENGALVPAGIIEVKLDV